jgi:subtilase family serine protease
MNKEYEFAVKDPVSGVMTVKQPYGPSNTFPYVPTNAGTYSIRVYVRNVGSAASYEAAQWYFDNVVTSSPITSVALGASPAIPQVVNTPVTFTATATGGGPNKEYEFAVKDPASGVMTVKQPYGSSNTFPYTPTAAGTYTIRVYARNVGSPVSYEAALWITDNVTP